MMSQELFTHMFALPLPVVEKLLRPVIVYLVLVVLLRIFGKRELAQLNPFDLVVLLSLSNTVQNAIIGDDNSVSGGVVGAIGLLGINWLVVRVVFRSRRLTRLFEGRATVLVRNGQVDERALNKEMLTREELMDIVHRNGLKHLREVRRCELEPNGTFYVEAMDPSTTEMHHAELVAKIEALTRAVEELKAERRG